MVAHKLRVYAIGGQKRKLARRGMYRILILFVLFFPLFSNASIGQYSVSSSCQLTIDFGFDISDFMPEETAYFTTYLGTFPSITSTVGGSTGYNSTYWDFLGSGSASVVSSSSQTITYDVLILGDYFTYGSGDRWIRTQNIPDSMPQLEYPFTILSDGTCLPVSNPLINSLDETYETRFLSASLSHSSSSSNFNISYYLDTNDFSSQYNRPDVVMVNLATSDDLNYASKQKIILPMVTGNGSTTVSMASLPDGQYTANINFWNMANQKFVLNRSSLTLNFVISGGSLISQSIVDSSNGLFATDPIEYKDCGFTSLDGCLYNFGLALFYPADFSTDLLFAQFELLKTRQPFSYFNQVSSAIQTASVLTPASSSFVNLQVTVFGVTVPILTQSTLDAIYSNDTRLLVRNFISHGLWIAFGLTLLYMILNIFNRVAYMGEQSQQTPSHHGEKLHSYSKSR